MEFQLNMVKKASKIHEFSMYHLKFINPLYPLLNKFKFEI